MAKLSYGTIITWHTLPRDTTSWKQQKLLHYIYLLHRKNIFGTVTVCVKWKSFSSGLLSLSLSLVFRPKCSKLCSIQGVIYEKHVCCVPTLYFQPVVIFVIFSIHHSLSTLWTVDCARSKYVFAVQQKLCYGNHCSLVERCKNGDIVNICTP